MAKAQAWWMSPSQLKRYQKLSSELFDLHKAHQALIAKAVKKTISRDEAKQLREVIRTISHVDAERKKLEDENPLKPENVLKALDQAKNR